MEDQAVVGRELADVLATLAEEGEFAQGLAATVTPEVETHQRPGVIVRDDHAVRLDRSVDLRLVPAHDQAGLAGPRGLASEERGGAGLALDDQIVGGLEFALVEILIVATGPIDGLVEDLNVGQKLFQSRVLSLGLGSGVDGRTKLGELLGECDLLRLGQCHGLVGRRNRPDGGGNIILRTVGQGRRGEKGKKQEGAHAK